MLTRVCGLAALLLSLSAVAAAPAPKFMKMAREGKDLYATLRTNQGDIVVRLFARDAPITVENFVGLATGEKEWTDPRTQQKVTGKPLYGGVIFHRVIPNFMIQGGDPLGQGTGDPGYRFQDEFQSGRKFDKVGLLAMANAGPNTNGSQFFITTSTPTYLNNRHTIFGEVISGYEVAVAISNVPRGPRDRPNADVVIKTITVSDKSPKAEPAKAAPVKGKK
ncbi:MAG: peptidylprolyl isomerase [Deltaproteobacteria bacterium]|nr:peptidylprolyl isomerase [Deltaproteobacteria bacterium]